MVTALKTEDSCQQVIAALPFGMSPIFYVIFTRLRLVIRKEQAY